MHNDHTPEPFYLPLKHGLHLLPRLPLLKGVALLKAWPIRGPSDVVGLQLSLAEFKFK